MHHQRGAYAFIIVLVMCLGFFAAVAYADTAVTATNQTILVSSLTQNPAADTSLVSQVNYNGNLIDEHRTGPGLPPPGWVANANVPDMTTVTAIKASTMSSTDVPALLWSYGCSATSATMYVGYYDRNGYPNMYTGPTNGGVFPLDNTVWGYSSEGHGECPLTASQKGVDSRVINGSVDDYYYGYGSSVDPYYNNWAQHSPLDSVADYMGTNQYKNWHNTDGSTMFYFDPTGAALNDYSSSEITGYRDGAHGLKLFIESRGYAVTADYNQYILGEKSSTNGFTFAQYQSEIDAGNPVLIQIATTGVGGHTMLGVGYSGTNTIIVHDTWDYSDHTMTWGGSYSGMHHYGVTVIHLRPVANFTATPTSGIAPLSISFTDTSGGNPTSWLWNFGDGNTTGATQQNPVHLYTTVGTYPVSLTVTNTNGSNTTTQAGYISVSAPRVNSLSPSSGPAAGGTTVTITGNGFTGANTVMFGSTANATGAMTVNSDTRITVTSPAHAAGTFDVTVTNITSGTSPVSANDKFTYIGIPVVTGISPPTGRLAGGNSVTITGTNFTGANAVTFGSTPATTYTVNSATQITATSPAGSGTVDVMVTNTTSGTSATSSADRFTYVAVPTVTSVSPGSGPASGGITVTITGTGFTGATAVKFGSISNTTPVSVTSATTITVIIPPHAAGTIDVTVTTPGGTSAINQPADQYTCTPSLSEIGVYRASNQMFYLDANANGVLDSPPFDTWDTFGIAGDLPVSGDWNHDGIIEIGVYRPSTHMFYLDYNGNGVWEGPTTDRSFNTFGITGDLPVSGDWNHNGITEIGVYRPSTHMFYLDYNGNGIWDGPGVDRSYNFGITGDLPVTGDWNKDGITEIGVYRPSTHMFYLDYNGNGVWEGPTTDRSFNTFGITGDLPVSGDWNSDGISEIGVYRPSTHMFYLDLNGNGVWEGPGVDRSYNFGMTGDTPLI